MPKVCSTVVRMGNNGRVVGDCYKRTQTARLVGDRLTVSRLIGTVMGRGMRHVYVKHYMRLR